MEKQNRKFLNLALIVSIVGSVFNFVGMILMFLDEYVKTYNKFSYYSYYPYVKVTSYSSSYENPEAGIIPLIALLVVIASIVIIAMLKKSKGKHVVYYILSVIAQSLLFSAIAMLKTGIDGISSEEAFSGYYLCDTAGSLIFVATIFVIIDQVILKKKNGLENTSSNNATYVSAQTNQTTNGNLNVDNPTNKSEKSKVDRIKEIKELLDIGCINEDEYESAKKKILEK